MVGALPAGVVLSLREEVRGPEASTRGPSLKPRDLALQFFLMPFSTHRGRASITVKSSFPLGVLGTESVAV